MFRALNTHTALFILNYETIVEFEYKPFMYLTVSWNFTYLVWILGKILTNSKANELFLEIKSKICTNTFYKKSFIELSQYVQIINIISPFYRGRGVSAALDGKTAIPILMKCLFLYNLCHIKIKNHFYIKLKRSWRLTKVN